MKWWENCNITKSVPELKLQGHSNSQCLFLSNRKMKHTLCKCQHNKQINAELKSHPDGGRWGIKPSQHVWRPRRKIQPNYTCWTSWVFFQFRVPGEMRLLAAFRFAVHCKNTAEKRGYNWSGHAYCWRFRPSLWRNERLNFKSRLQRLNPLKIRASWSISSSSRAEYEEETETVQVDLQFTYIKQNTHVALKAQSFNLNVPWRHFCSQS